MNELVGKMREFIPEGTCGEFSINHFELTQKHVELERLRGMFDPYKYMETYDLKPGHYTRLVWNNKDVVMSDTPMELRTQDREVRLATGDCLIGGLGLGILVLQLQAKPEVTSILVVEKSQEVVNLVAPHLPLTPKVKIVQGDIFDKRVIDRKLRFDFIFFDIWNNICSDSAPDISKLKRAWRPLLRKENPAAWMGAWRERDFYRLRREANRSQY